MKKYKITAENLSTELLSLETVQLFFKDVVSNDEWLNMQVGETRQILFYNIECMEVDDE